MKKIDLSLITWLSLLGMIYFIYTSIGWDSISDFRWGLRLGNPFFELLKMYKFKYFFDMSVNKAFLFFTCLIIFLKTKRNTIYKEND